MKYNFGDSRELDKDYSLCPVCGEKAALVAKRPQLDSLCPNGHEWHTDLKTNTVKEGPAE